MPLKTYDNLDRKYSIEHSKHFQLTFHYYGME